MTLMEILVVLSVIGIIVGMSAPAMVRYAGQMRLKATVRQVVGLLSLARSLAVSQRADHTVIVDADAGRITVRNEASGQWLEQAVALPRGLAAEVLVAGQPAQEQQVAFRSTGALNGRSATLVLSGQAKQVIINITAATGAITVQ